MFIFADGPCLAQLNPIPHFANISLIMGLELRHPAENLFVYGMNDGSFNGDNNGLIHLVADDVPKPLTSMFLTFVHTPFLSYFSTA